MTYKNWIKFFAYCFLKVHLHHSSQIKAIKKSQNSRNQRLSYYFCLMMEGFGSGSLPLTNGSGRPKNLQIRMRTLLFGVVFYVDYMSKYSHIA
jgi:hypothetical protein